MSSKIIDTNKEYKYGFTTDIETEEFEKGLSKNNMLFTVYSSAKGVNVAGTLYN